MPEAKYLWPVLVQGFEGGIVHGDVAEIPVDAFGIRRKDHFMPCRLTSLA